MNDDDTELRRAFGALRADDERNAPAFAASVIAARAALRARREGRRRTLVGAALVTAAAAALLLALVRPQPAPLPELPSPEPLAFLSRPPSTSVFGGEPLGVEENVR